MTGDRNWLLPVFHARLDPPDYDRRAEYGSVQYRTDRPIRAFPHFFQLVFRHTGSIGRNRRTLHGNSVFLRSLRRIYCHLVVRFITVFQAEIVIFRL